MQSPYPFLSFGHPHRLILAVSIAGAFSLAACERKPGTGETTILPNPSLTESSSDQSEKVIVTTTLPGKPVSQTRSLETIRLGEALDVFEAEPTVEHHSTVKLAFAKLDGEIAELEDRVVKTEGTDRAEAAVKLDNLQKYRTAQALRFPNSQDEAPLDGAPATMHTETSPEPADSRSATQTVGDTAAKVGDHLEAGAEKVGDTLKRAAHKTGEVIHDATH